MCIVCLELAKGSITKKEALGAFKEMVHTSSEDPEHLNVARDAIFSSLVEDGVRAKLGEPPWKPEDEQRAREEVIDQLVRL